MTAEIVSLLKRLEGYQQYPYWDYKGYSIGYGHFIGADKSAWTGGISEARATEILIADIAIMEGYVQQHFNQSLLGRKLDAITLFAFNFGPGKLKEATFIKLIKEGETDAAKIEQWWHKWNTAGGKYNSNLDQRRMMEADIWFGRPIRIPTYIGGGILNLLTNIPAPSTPEAITFPPKKASKIPILPLAIGGALLAGSVGAIIYYNRPLRQTQLNGLVLHTGFVFPFWAKVAIGLGVFTIGITAVAYAAKTNQVPGIKSTILPNNQIEDMTTKYDGKFILFSSVATFAKWLSTKTIKRKIDHIQLHCTDKPDYSHFTGTNHFALAKGIESSHIGRGFAEIGENITIFPDGKIMVCRDFDKTCACITGHNTGGLCIENVGLFDKGKDKMKTAQANAIVGTVKALLQKFQLTPQTGVQYHHWHNPNKSCPGNAFFGGNTRQAFEQNLLPLLTTFTA